MNPHDQSQLERWLEAETTESPQAEEALVSLFSALPRPAPSAGFAARVGARVRPLATAPARLGVRRGVLAWLFSAFCLVACLAVTPWLLGPAVAALAGGPSLLNWLTEGVARASQLLVALILGLGRLFELAQSFAATAARTPALALGMLLILGLATLAFWALERTLARERMVPGAGF